MSERAKVDALKYLVRASAEEAKGPAVLNPFDASTFPETPALDGLMDALRNSDALYVLDELLNGEDAE